MEETYRRSVLGSCASTVVARFRIVPVPTLPPELKSPARQEIDMDTKIHTSVRLQPIQVILFAFSFFCAITLPRGAHLLLVLFASYGAIEMLLRTDAERFQISFDRVALLVAAFGTYAVLSAFWAPSHWHAVIAGGQFIALACLASIANKYTGTRTQGELPSVILGTCAGITLGTLFVSIDAITNLELSRIILTSIPELQDRYQFKHLIVENGIVVWASDAFTNRPTTVAALFLIPGLYLAKQLGPRAFWSFTLPAPLFIVCAAVMHNQAAQISLIFAFVVGLLAKYSLTIARGLTLTVWLVAVSCSPLIALGMHAYHLQDETRLPESARQRVLIWAATANQIADHPIHGLGTGAAQFLNDRKILTLPDGAQAFRPPPARHAHNVFLQSWHELGALGAFLLLMTGLSMIGKIDSLPMEAQRFALAHFALNIGLMASSYSILQWWYLGAVAVSVLLFCYGVRLSENSV